jgi:hypothetical protein
MAGGGYYIYQTTFTIPAGYIPSTAIIGGRLTSDNETWAIFLNNVAVAGVPVSGTSVNGPNDIDVWTNFSITSGFVTGVNTLDFEVRNRGLGGVDASTTDTGLRVEFTSGVSDAPEPATFVLAGSMLLGLGLVRRRGRPTDSR